MPYVGVVLMLSEWVDFHYNDYEYSIEGGTSIKLSELFKILEIPLTVDQVADVTFSDPDLVEVTYTQPLFGTVGDWTLTSLAPFLTEETLHLDLKDGTSLDILVTDAQMITTYLSDSGELFEVTVSYGANAQIPEDATLKVTEFAEGTDDYDYAWKTVLADKQAKGEPVDFESMAALDISILDAEGNKIEPAAPVQVDMKIKDLPGVEDLEEVASSLTINHHVETSKGVVVETVYDGGTDASFRMDTDEAVAAAGKAVDPEKADLSAYSTFELTSDGAMVGVEPEVEEEEIDVSFPTEAFSTFTISWSNATNTSTKIRWRYNNNNTRGQVTANYVNTDGASITRPNGIYNEYDISVSNEDFENTLVFSSNTVARNINGRTYQKAYIVLDGTETEITRVTAARRTSWSWYTTTYSMTYYNGNEQVYTASGNGSTNFDRPAVYLQYTSLPTDKNATIHYVDEDGNELTVSKGSISNSTLLNNYAYLIYDIEGGEYEYKETYLKRGSTNTTIRAYLYWNGTNWRYTTNGSNWSSFNDNDDIYVVYKKKPKPTDGGTPTLVELGENDKPEAPTVTKESTVNGDGTNTLSLSVTSHTKPREVLKLADVIVIFDVSGSMKKEINSDNDTNNTSKQRLALLKSAVNSLARDLIGDNSAYIYTDPITKKKTKQIEMSLISFSNSASDATAFTDNLSTFSGWVNALGADGGTNWEHALQKANEAAVDAGRATFVIFVTDGEPTFRVSRMTNTDSSLANDFYTNDFYNDYKVYGTGSSDNVKDDTEEGRNYRAALAQAQAIVGKDKNLYMIGVGPEVKAIPHKDIGRAKDVL